MRGSLRRTDYSELSLRQVRAGQSTAISRLVLQVNQARDKLGYAPKIGLEQGLTEEWDWIRATDIKPA